MKTGAFALIDALGFKGIWKRTSEEELLAKLRRMASNAVSLASYSNETPHPVGATGVVGDMHATFLSDSIAMAIELGRKPSDSNATPEGRALGSLVLQLSQLLRAAALTDPPLVYRGVITFGDFTIDDRFILGPAVDTAAQYEREAEGAFVWLDPKAKQMLERDPHERADPSFPEGVELHLTHVPLKQGRSFETYAVLPFRTGSSSKRQVIDRILSTFDDQTLEVVLKKENTRRFLEAGAEASTRAYEFVPTWMRTFHSDGPPASRPPVSNSLMSVAGRTEQKLVYALVMIDEIRNRVDYDDFQRAHEEACLFHLVGAIENTLQELNAAYGLDLAKADVTLRSLRERSREQPRNAALASAVRLFDAAKNDRQGWLSLVYELRNTGGHREHAGQVVAFGMGPGVAPQKNSFKDPRDGALVPGTTAEALDRWVGQARALIAEIRVTYP